MTNCGKMRFVSMFVLAALLGRSLGEDAGSDTVVVGNDSDGGTTVTQQGGDEPAPTMTVQDGVNPGSDASQEDGNEPAPAMSAQSGGFEEVAFEPTTVFINEFVVGPGLPVASGTVPNVQDGIDLGFDETFLESVFIIQDETRPFEVNTGIIFSNDPTFQAFTLTIGISIEDGQNDQGELQEVQTRTVTLEGDGSDTAIGVSNEFVPVADGNFAAPPVQPPLPSDPVVSQQGIPSVGDVVVQIPFSLLFDEAMVETLAPTEEDRFRISNNLSARDAASRPSTEVNLFGNRDTDRSSTEESTGPGSRIFDRLSGIGVGTAGLRGAVGDGGRGFLP